MTDATPSPRGCSPWALLGCGCGLLAICGIALVFLLLGISDLRGRKDPAWNPAAYETCQHRLLLLGSALDSYRQDYHHRPARLEELAPRYVESRQGLRCPLGGPETYRYFPNAAAPTDILVECDEHGQGRILLLCNGKLLLMHEHNNKKK